MTNMRKILCVVVVVGMMICLFGACNKAKKEIADPKESMQKIESNGEATAEPEKETEPENDAQSTDEESAKEKTLYESILSDGFKDFGGKISYGLHIYDSGIKISNENSQMKSASVIKLFIMEYAYNQMVKGELASDSVISGQKLLSLIESMITVSSNEATNILIDFFGMDKINSFIKENNYTDTVLQRRMLDTAAASRGEENYTSVSDVMNMLDKFYENKDVYPYNEMLDIMKRQQVSTKLRRDMPKDVVIASKTGELSDVENDVAIVFSEAGDYAIVCLTKDGNASVARNSIATVCRKVYDTMWDQRQKMEKQ